jgi:tRNA(adenine34) deaminase
MADTATDERMMRLALERAAAAAAHDDVPIGAVVARGAEVLAAAGNERELRHDPTAHAEVLALRSASEKLGGWRLPETTLYVTLEPCAMCAGAISLARVPRVVYAAPDPKGGALGGVVDLYSAPNAGVLNHLPEVEAGVLGEEAGEVLRAFFAERRGRPPGERPLS